MTRLASLLMAAAVAVLAAAPAHGAGDRALILVAKQFNKAEFWVPFEVLRAAGYRVDVAAPERGPVPLSDKGPRPQDAPANLALEEVDPSNYAGLVIPGGYSPGNLEKVPRALDICRAFMKDAKPVAAVCHGPRLLMRAGLTKDRVVTCLYGVANELADAWKGGAYGRYLDEAVVVDANLVTSRYPGDLAPFMRAMLQLMEKSGGLPVPARRARAAVAAPGLGGHEKWTMTEVPEILGVDVAWVGSADDAAKVAQGEAAPDLLLVLDAKGFAALAREAAFRDLVASMAKAGRPILADRKVLATVRALGAPQGAVTVVEGSPQDMSGWLRPIVVAAEKVGKPDEWATPEAPRSKLAVLAETKVEGDATGPYDAALALREGFDGLVVAAMAKYLKGKGRKVIVVGAATGTSAGLNGLEVEVQATYEDEVDLAKDALIVMPGGLWPEKSEARQAEQPAWIEAQAARDEARMAWVMTRREAGATIVAFGFDSLRIGRRNEAFAGKAFAAPDQTVWGFGKGGGKYGGSAAALVTDERLITAKGPGAIADAVTRIEAAK